MTNTTRNVIAGIGVLALLAPAGALAKESKARAGKGDAKPRTFVLKGSVTSVDAAATDVTVQVAKGNAAARRFVGQELTFDVAAAKLVVADTDGDGSVAIGDVRPGDRVTVQVRAPRDVAGDAPLAARKLVDHTAPPEGEDDAEVAPPTAP